MVDATAETIRVEIQRRLRKGAPHDCRNCAAPRPVPSGLNAYGSNWSVGTMQGTPRHCLIFVLGVVGEVMAEYELVGSQ